MVVGMGQGHEAWAGYSFQYYSQPAYTGMAERLLAQPRDHFENRVMNYSLHASEIKINEIIMVALAKEWSS